MTSPEQPHLDALQAYFLGELPPLEAERIRQLAAQDPTLAAALDELHQTGEGLARAAATPPPAHLRARILATIGELAKEEALDLAQPPRISQHSDARLWYEAVKGLEPNGVMDGYPVYVLQDSPQVQQLVLWLDDVLQEEPHQATEFTESFLILSGHCHCEFGTQSWDLQAGDYVVVPSETAHTIRNTTPDAPVVAIVQRCIAA